MYKNENLDKSLGYLVRAWNAFNEQKQAHNPDDLNDFRKAIHDGQRIIFTIMHQNNEK